MKTCMQKILFRKKKEEKPVLIREESGIQVGISHDLVTAARHSASHMSTQYHNWLNRNRHTAWGNYKQCYFTVAVGGGNTMKANYDSWLTYHHSDIDWISHLRFFFLEESSGERGWESAENSLVIHFIEPIQT